MRCSQSHFTVFVREHTLFICPSSGVCSVFLHCLFVVLIFLVVQKCFRMICDVYRLKSGIIPSCFLRLETRYLPYLLIIVFAKLISELAAIPPRCLRLLSLFSHVPQFPTHYFLPLCPNLPSPKSPPFLKSCESLLYPSIFSAEGE